MSKKPVKIGYTGSGKNQRKQGVKKCSTSDPKMHVKIG